MQRYINKDILLHKLQERCNKLYEQYGTEDDYTRGYGAAIDAIDIIVLKETADVQEVKHGKWIELVKIRKGGEIRLVHWQCSLCGCFLGTNTESYCPNCGAKMDLEEKE